MSETRSSREKLAIAIAAAATAWVIGSTLFYQSGDINPAGILPTVACLLALGAAIDGSKTWMWVGTTLALIFSAALVFSVGLFVTPAAVALLIGSVLLNTVTSGDSRSRPPGRAQ